MILITNETIIIAQINELYEQLREETLRKNNIIEEFNEYMEYIINNNLTMELEMAKKNMQTIICILDAQLECIRDEIAIQEQYLSKYKKINKN